jgi:hypothetical protein
MGLIARYLERLSALIRRGHVDAPPTVSAAPDGLQIGEDHIAWSDMTRLDAYKRDAYIGDHLCLAILSSGGQVFEISEASPGWHEAGQAIERFLPGALPQAEWTLRLLALQPGQSVMVYSAH